MARSDPRDKPKLETALQEFYAELVKRSEEREIDGKKVLVFEGYIKSAFNRAVGNLAYYTPMRKILLETESITQLQVGNIGQPTILILHHPPPPQAQWPDDLTGAQVSATMKAEFGRRIAALEVWRENLTGGGKVNILEVLIDFEGRIAKLETELGQLAKKEGKDNGKST